MIDRDDPLFSLAYGAREAAADAIEVIANALDAAGVPYEIDYSCKLPVLIMGLRDGCTYSVRANLRAQ